MKQYWSILNSVFTILIFLKIIVLPICIFIVKKYFGKITIKGQVTYVNSDQIDLITITKYDERLGYECNIGQVIFKIKYRKNKKIKPFEERLEEELKK